MVNKNSKNWGGCIINRDALKVMYQFLEEHPVEAGQLKSIDTSKIIICFSDNCEA